MPRTSSKKSQASGYQPEAMAAKPSSLNKATKVLMVGPYPPPYGGIAVVVRDLLESPLSSSVDLRLMRSHNPREDTSNLEGDYLVRGFMDLCSLIKELLRFRPQVVHIHTSYDYGWPRNVLLALVSKAFGAKVLLHIHAYNERCKDGFPRTILRRLIFTPSMAFDIADHIFTLSDKYTNNILAYYPDKKVTTVFNCITMKRYLENKEKVGGEKIVVSYIGRLDKRKGVHELLNAVEKISEKVTDVIFKIVGIGPEKDYVENWMNRSAASSAVEYLGFVSEEEKIRILKLTDIFVLQSTNEGVPISLLEAIASGCAIISTPVGSIADIVDHGRNGLMIKPEDPDALVGAIMTLHDDRPMLRRMQSENLANRLEYAWEKKAEEIASIYIALAQER